MKVFKRFTIFSMAIMMLATNSISVLAEKVSPQAIYDLKKGGTQIFEFQDENGEMVEVVIEELETDARIANGNYKVTYKKTAAWEAGFYVEISSNKILRAYSPFYTVIAGSITSTSLVRNSTTKATYSFLHKVAIVNYNTGVVATMVGTDLIVNEKS